MDFLHGFGVLSTYVLAFIGVLWVPAFLWLAVGYWYSSRRPTFRPPPLGLWAMLLSPFVILLYATIGYGSAKGPNAPAWPAQIHIALVVSQIVLVFWLSWRYRSRPAFTIPTAVAALAFIVIAFYISAMAMADDWI